jgi:D-alanyl-D-alanine carboxypeptidase
MKNIKNYVLVVLLLFGVFLVSDSLSIVMNKNSGNTQKKVSIKNNKNPFENISLEAQAVYVYDLNKKEVLFAKNEEMQIPLASLTKVMTAIIASKNSKNEETLTVNRKNLIPEGDSGLLVDEDWSLKNLIDFTLVSSSNDGASMLASVISVDSDDEYNSSFVRKMNYMADKIGMNQTYFLNESGLDLSKNISGAYGSAKDMAILFSYLLNTYPNLLEATTYETIKVESSAATHKVKNTNKIIDKIPGVIASKTGFTDLSGGNLVIAYDAGPMHPIVISVMGSSMDGRFRDVNKLVEASLMSL